MMTEYYLVARPETIVSLVQVGRLPEKLPDWITVRRLQLHANPLTAVAESTTNSQQTFLLKILVPEAESTHLISEQLTQNNDKSVSIYVEQVDPHWIARIYVKSLQGRKLLSGIFNSECPVSIEIHPSFFDRDNEHHQSLTFDSSASTVTNLISVKTQGDLLGSRMQTLVNTVNCVGVMGKGIALQFKERYPAMFEDYKRRCDRKEVKLGEPYLYRESQHRFIINFPTKNNWRHSSCLADIESGLQYLAAHLAEWGVTSLAIPPLGCGNGGLNWDDVEPLIRRYLMPLNIPIEIYVPFTGSKADKRKSPSAASDFWNPRGSKRSKHDDEDDSKKEETTTTALLI